MDLPSDLLKLLGGLSLVVAGAMVAPVVGVAVAGVLLLVAGWLTERL